VKKLWNILLFVFCLPLAPIMGAGLIDLLAGGMAQAKVPARVGWKDFVQVEDGDAAYDTEAEVFGAIGAVGAWSRIWEMECPAQQEVAWGYGTAGLPTNQGYMWFVAMLDGTGYDVGTLRLVIEDHNRTYHPPVVSMADSGLHLEEATFAFGLAIPRDRNQMTPLPEKREFPTVHEDSRLAIDYLPRVLVAEDRCNFRIPITRYY